MKINDIEFDIKKIEISRESIPVNFGFSQHMAPGRTEIKIIAQTDNKNIIKLSDWRDLVGYKASYKADVNYNGIFIAGIFPIDYTFNHNNIDVILSADYVSGDINLLYQRKLRKEKLQKINRLIPLYNIEI